MATNSIEIEAKVLLSRKDYLKLLENMSFNDQVKIQKNYYLDSEDRTLKKYGMAIRLRQREGKNKLTLKAPLAEGLLTKNQDLNDDEANALINNNLFPRGDISDFLDILHIDVNKLLVLAQLTTERKEGTYDGLDINISKNTYSNTVDYELECDSDSVTNSQNALKDICQKYRIDYKVNTVSKESRAINAALSK